AQEKKKNRQQLMALNKEIKEKNKEMDAIDDEISILQKQLNEKIERKKIIKSEERILLSKINELQLRILSLKITVNPDVSLEGNESIQDLFYSHEERRKALGTTLVEINKMVMDNVYKNALVDEYNEKYGTLVKELNKSTNLCRNQLKKITKQIDDNVNRKISELEGTVHSLSPSEINLDNLSEADTKKYLTELIAKHEEMLSVCNQSVMNYLNNLSALDMNGEGLALLETYKSKEIELSSKVDMFYELAQVGMSIEVVDHQFNVLYSQINSELQLLAREAHKEPELTPIYNALIVSFQHMESNHKMLMPLYRNTRRVRKKFQVKILKTFC
ncbi:MAG: hypothetical protein LUE92_02795, partial [Clostridiales bacterium]|nr:hypothetical protein [Clostridiales bacterium]